MDKERGVILSAPLVKDIPDLWLNPLGLVLQCSQRDRIIFDYSFFGVNYDTVPLAPPKVMRFGQTLKCLLQRIHRANDHFGSVCMSKIDLSREFYWLWLRPEDTIKLVVLFPAQKEDLSLWGFLQQILWNGVLPRQISVRALKQLQTLPMPLSKIQGIKPKPTRAPID